MRILKLSDLPPFKELAVIVNVATRLVTTLAVLSTLRYAKTPALVIDCESQDGSFEWLGELMSQHDFHLISSPLRPHGETLDWIFREIPAEHVLLVDSDVEVLSSEMLEQMRTMLFSSERMFGSGFIEGPAWLKVHYGTDLPLAPGIGYYKQRPWIPFTLLRVASVRQALASLRSFMHRLVLNEFPSSPVLSKIMWRRFRWRAFRENRLHFLDAFRKSYNGVKPAYIFYDTGADVYEYLNEVVGLPFGGIPAGVVPWSVRHHHGVTRGTLQGKSHDATSLSQIDIAVRERLAKTYDVRSG